MKRHPDHPAPPWLWAAAAVPRPPDDEIRQQLAEVFQGREFNPPSRTWLEWLTEQLARFFQWLGVLHDVSPLLYWLLLAGCVVVLLLLLAHIVWTVRRAFFVDVRAAGGETAVARRGRLSATYREEALRRAAQGDFTEAVRYLFLSLVYRFDESGRVSFHKSYTNREYLALFADRQQSYAQLKTFVDTLDDHWYGQRPTDRGQYERCLSLYENVA